MKSTGNNSWKALCSGPSGVEFSMISKDSRANLMAKWKTTDSTGARNQENNALGQPWSPGPHSSDSSVLPPHKQPCFLRAPQVISEGSRGQEPTVASTHSPGFRGFFHDSNGHLFLHVPMSSSSEITSPGVLSLISGPQQTGIGSCWILSTVSCSGTRREGSSYWRVEQSMSVVLRGSRRWVPSSSKVHRCLWGAKGWKVERSLDGCGHPR